MGGRGMVGVVDKDRFETSKRESNKKRLLFHRHLVPGKGQ